MPAPMTTPAASPASQPAASPPSLASLPDLSVVVITRNEVANIEACLASVPCAVDRVVVDSGSTDGTAAAARRAGARVIDAGGPEAWPGFGAQKQRAVDAARGRWILSLDADERVTPELAEAIRAIVTAPESPRSPIAYELSRLSRFAGRWIRHGAWYPDPVLRLFRAGQARFSDDRVHERVIVTGDGSVARLDGARHGHLLHETMPTYADALAKLDRYSSESAAARVARGQRAGLRTALLHAGWAFVRSYVVKRGFLDGAAGFIVAAYVAEGSWWRYLKIEEARRAGAGAGGEADRARGLPRAP